MQSFFRKHSTLVSGFSLMVLNGILCGGFLLAGWLAAVLTFWLGQGIQVPVPLMPLVILLFFTISVMGWTIYARIAPHTGKEHWVALGIGVSPLVALSVFSFLAAVCLVFWPGSQGTSAAGALGIAMGSLVAVAGCVGIVAGTRLIRLPGGQG